MEKKITITMNQIDGTIDFEHEGNPTYAESLGMIEYAKALILKDLIEEVSQ